MNGVDIDKRNQETNLYRSDVLEKIVKNPLVWSHPFPHSSLL
jgi:hypothetical protein